MRDRLAVLAATSTMCLVLAVSPYARAQQETQRPAGNRNENPTAGQNRIGTRPLPRPRRSVASSPGSPPKERQCSTTGQIGPSRPKPRF